MLWRLTQSHDKGPDSDTTSLFRCPGPVHNALTGLRKVTMSGGTVTRSTASGWRGRKEERKETAQSIVSVIL